MFHIVYDEEHHDWRAYWTPTGTLYAVATTEHLIHEYTRRWTQ